MHVCLINIEHPIFTGGRQTYIVTLIKYLTQCKEIDKVTHIVVEPPLDFTNDKYLSEVYSNDKFQEVCISVPLNSGQIFFAEFIKIASRKIDEIHKDDKIDIVHSHGVVDSHAALKLRKIYKVPILQTIHSPPPSDEKFWLDNAKNFVDLTVVLSKCMERWAISVGYPVSKLSVIPGFVDFELFNPNINKEQIKETKQIFGLDKLDESSIIIYCPARFSPAKGVDVLFKALYILNKHQNMTNIRVLLTGRGASRELLLPHSKLKLRNFINYLYKLGKDLQIDNLVINYERLFDMEKRLRIPYELLPCLYKISDLVVYPSLLYPHFEAFGLVAIESMRMCVPIISTKNGGLAEIIRNFETGILVEPGNHIQLANAIRIMTENDELKYSIIQKAKEHVKKYNAKDIVKDLVNVYLHLLSRG
jgi:glycosyltransferase involved in cell wall biosynthesis